jgi:branched-chain amino acid transport system permease protein
MNDQPPVVDHAPPQELPRLPLSRMRSWGISALHNAWIPVLIFATCRLGRHYEFADNPGAYVMHVAMIAAINIILAVSLQLINGVSGQFSLGHAGFMAVGAYLGGYSTLTFAQRGYDPNADYPDPRLQFANPGGVLLFFVAIAIVALIAATIGWILFMLLRKSKALHSTLPIVLTLALLTWLVFDARAAFDAPQIPAGCVWSRGAIALANLYNAILVHGASPAFWLTDILPAGLRKPLCLLIALIGGGFSAAAAGLLVGLPTLRLRGDYLAIATLGFAEIIRNVIVTIPALGAATGMSINVYWTRPSAADHIDQPFYISTWIFGTAALTILIIGRLVRSPKGKAIQTVRDDEIAAAAMGIDPTRHRVLAFVTGAFFAGVAGALYAHTDGYLNSNSFSFLRSIEIVVMVTLGGLGSLWGAAIAATVLTVIPELLDNADRFLPKMLGSEAHWMANNRLVLYSLLLLIIVIAKARLRPHWNRKWNRKRNCITLNREQ